MAARRALRVRTLLCRSVSRWVRKALTSRASRSAMSSRDGALPVRWLAWRWVSNRSVKNASTVGARRLITDHLGARDALRREPTAPERPAGTSMLMPAPAERKAVLDLRPGPVRA